MSVQTEIDRIITAVGNAYDSVATKGGTVPTDETVANLAAAIDSIPSGSGGSGFPNGTEWTQSNITSGDVYTSYNSNGIWVAGSNNGLYYSTDCKTWTQSNITSKTIYSVYNANGIWVACGGGLYCSVTWEA